MSFKIRITDDIRSVPAPDWNALVAPDDPFTSHSFLALLESSASVGPGTGWHPQHVLVESEGVLVGAAPAYLKAHSYGEYVFDWGWAGAAERAGMDYYPKLVAAVPFTPAGGHRLLVRTGGVSGKPTDKGQVQDTERAIERAIERALVLGLEKVAEAHSCSSIHILFCPESTARHLSDLGYFHRQGMQFHWENRPDNSYEDFTDFLGAFKARCRKQVKKERRIAQGHGLAVETKTGAEMAEADWDVLSTLYDSNAERHGAIPYLRPAFFEQLPGAMKDQVVVSFAYDERRVPVAGTLNFEQGDVLYGRYWGATTERDMLHFELCYYQLIDRAIAKGHRRFEAGAQGEHKLRRGLLPRLTHSAHKIFTQGWPRPSVGSSAWKPRRSTPGWTVTTS